MYFECLCHSTWRAKFNWKRKFTLKTWLWTKYGLLCLSRSTFFIQGISCFYVQLFSTTIWKLRWKSTLSICFNFKQPFRWYDQVCLWKCKRNIRFFLIIATLVRFVFKCYCRNIIEIHPAIIAHRIPQIRFWFLHWVSIALVMMSISIPDLQRGKNSFIS